MLIEEVYKQTDIELSVSHKWPESASAVIIAGTEASLKGFIAPYKVWLEQLTEEFDIPQQAVADGHLRLAWTVAEGKRGAQVAELWLIRKEAKAYFSPLKIIL